MKDLICFGEVLYDNYPQKKVLAGAPLNVANFASALGLNTAIISAINKSDNSTIAKISNIEPWIQKNNYKTGQAYITLDKGIPRFQIQKDSAFDHIKPLHPATDAKFFYFGTLAQRRKESRNTLHNILKNTNAIKVYDVNLRTSPWKDIVKDSIKQADIIKVNEEEFNKISQMNLKHKTVFVTQGDKGAYIHNTNLYASPPKIKAVDTTGCGDAFTAGIIFGLKNNWNKQRTLKFAVNLASNAAKYKGAFSNKILKHI